MSFATCSGCGRLIGHLRSELGCRCWQAIKPSSTVPDRLRKTVAIVRRRDQRG